MLLNKIRELRRKNRFTQKELANILGVSSSAVALWETGKREPDYETLVKISETFNVSLDYLLSSGKENVVTIIGRNGSYKSFTLNDEQIEAIENVAKTFIEDNNLW